MKWEFILIVFKYASWPAENEPHIQLLVQYAAVRQQLHQKQRGFKITLMSKKTKPH